jgi:hypothetical protein
MTQLDNAVARYKKIILDDLKDAGIKAWLAGGALRDYFMGVPIITDHDIFFPDEDNYNKAKDFFGKKEGVKVKWLSDNGMKVIYKKRTFDLIKHYFPGPQETIDAFDFTVSMFAVDQERVYHGESSFIDLAKRQLMINRLPYPASTMSRAFRYYKKGFLMCQGEMAKLVEAIQNMPKKETPKNEDGSDAPPSGDNGGLFIGIDYNYHERCKKYFYILRPCHWMRDISLWNYSRSRSGNDTEKKPVPSGIHCY